MEFTELLLAQREEVDGRLGLVLGILLMELVGLLVPGQEAIPDKAAGSRQAK